MKSNKQRRVEIRHQRLARAARLAAELRAADARFEPLSRRPGVEPADGALLARRNPALCVAPPRLYLDRPFTCRDCRTEQVWTARQQKWWHEDIGASLDTAAVRCLPCRRARRAARAATLAGEGADLLGQLSRRLRALADEPPTAESRTAVDQALVNKWWSLREVAISTLGRWAGPQDLARLRALVEAAPSSGKGWERLGARAAAAALAPHLRHPQDDDWMREIAERGRVALWPWRAAMTTTERQR